jgi:hypothetical protein
MAIGAGSLGDKWLEVVLDVRVAKNFVTDSMDKSKAFLATDKHR